MKTPIFIMTLLLPFFGCMENNDQKMAEIKRRNHEIAYEKEWLSQINDFNADTTWIYQLLENNDYRFNVFTIELEKVWLIDQPISIEALLVDISSHDEENYLLELETPYFSRKYIGIPDLYFRITFPKGIIDKLVATNPDLIGDRVERFDNFILCVAKIHKVEKATICNEGTSEQIRIGIGKGYDIKVVKSRH